MVGFSAPIDKQQASKENISDGDKSSLINTLQRILRDRKNEAEKERLQLEQHIPSQQLESYMSEEKRGSTGRCRHPNSMICQALYSTGNKRSQTSIAEEAVSTDKAQKGYGDRSRYNQQVQGYSPSEGNDISHVKGDIDWSQTPSKYSDVDQLVHGESMGWGYLKRNYKSDPESSLRKREEIQEMYRRLLQRVEGLRTELQERELVELSLNESD